MTRKAVTAYLTPTEHDQLKALAFLEKKSMSRLVKDGLTKVMKERKRNGR